MPPKQLIAKVTERLKEVTSRRRQRARDLAKGTRIQADIPIIQNSYIEAKQLKLGDIDPKIATYLSEMYNQHLFDLLGSGWIKNSYGIQAYGMEGKQYAMNVPAPECSPSSYEPIDWQKDFKSGFRWSQKTWYKDIQFGEHAGVDIKVPWELARLQHLPQLALFAMIDPELLNENIHQFKWQLLDFIEHNPPRMGVNWVCTMDVGIRAANILVAYDLFCQLDTQQLLDERFKKTVTNSIYEHGTHIVNNLEYSANLTSNHYLSNIAGLLYIAAYLQPSIEVDQWLAFSIQELINEMDNQFYEDGGNFESSTCYHRLSGELMLFSTALILGLKKNKVTALSHYTNAAWKVTPGLLKPNEQAYQIQNDQVILPAWYIERLYKIGHFTQDITRPDGDVPQFGDNDSGRFLKLTPNGLFIPHEQAVKQYQNLKNIPQNHSMFWDENHLNHASLIAGYNSLLKSSCQPNGFSLESSFVACIAQQKIKPANYTYKQPVKKHSKHHSLAHKRSIEHPFTNEIAAFDFIPYPDSGIYLFKSTSKVADAFYLAICATPNGQKGQGGHTHIDTLSYELVINGINICRDPGTYIYTAAPEQRNAFRGACAHNIPIVDQTVQNDWIPDRLGLFSLKSAPNCFVSDFSTNPNFIELTFEHKDIIIIRKFTLYNNQLCIEDQCNEPFDYSHFPLYSNGYGKLLKRDSSF